jgi:ribosome-associated protein
LTSKKPAASPKAAKPTKAKPKPKAGPPPARAAGPVRKGAAATRPKIRASHTARTDAPVAPRRRVTVATGGAAAAAKTGRQAPLRKVPLAAPKRSVKRAVTPDTDTKNAPPEPSSAARDFAVALATEGLEKKALGIEILDVTGKVDYADFLVVMTGRSDRHVHAIATGLEEAMRRRKVAPLSMEGLSSASWVLIDFGDVVVHVFQEEARLLYDIEGLWIDAGRIPVPADRPEGAPAPSPDAR